MSLLETRILIWSTSIETQKRRTIFEELLKKHQKLMPRLLCLN